MAVDDIIKKILADARKRAEEIKAQTDQKVEALIEEAKADAEKQRARMVESAEESLVDQRARAEAMAQLEARKDLLARKREHLQSIFNEAKDRLNKLPERQYAQLIEKQLKRIEVGKSFEIIVRPEDADRIESIARRIWGGSTDYKVVSGDKAVDGGFILRTGKFEYDNTFGSLLASLSERMEGEVTEILFGEGK